MASLYTSPTDVRTILRKLPSSVTDPEIILHIEKAGAFIDGMLGEVYATPIKNSDGATPELIKHISLDLTVFFLVEDLMSSQAPNLDEYHEKRYNRAMKMLEQILLGDLKVIGITPIITDSGSGFETTNDSDPIFTLDDPKW